MELKCIVCLENLIEIADRYEHNDTTSPINCVIRNRLLERIPNLPRYGTPRLVYSPSIIEVLRHYFFYTEKINLEKGQINLAYLELVK